jgi:putative tricarboxylic transport membrane protein
MLYQVLQQLLDPTTLIAIFASALFGVFMGAIPGLTATMATALLVPVTFFLPPIPAIATMVTATAVAIFAGDIPGCLLRIPGTPASAAYTDETYQMTRRGQSELALGASLISSAFGGLFGTAVLVAGAPLLAEFAVNFSSIEYFWLVLLGLTCAAALGSSDPLKGMISLMLGLIISMVGLNNPAGAARFTFGQSALFDGVALIPMMVGMFAMSEIMRFSLSDIRAPADPMKPKGSILRGVGGLFRKYPMPILRGSALGTVIGALPGAGADIAAWMAYGISRRYSREPEKFGTGHPEGVLEAGAANNSALAGAWIPALVFGIPGDSITAIVIGVLYMKSLNPGPQLFTQNPVAIYSIFALFVVANLVMIPLGLAAIKLGAQLVRVPRNVIMPIILLFCIVGSYAVNNSLFDVGVMLAFGVFAFILEESGFPASPAILGVILGTMLENYFVTSMISSGGNLTAFVARPIAAVLATILVLLWVTPFILKLRNRRADALAAARPHGPEAV